MTRTCFFLRAASAAALAIAPLAIGAAPLHADPIQAAYLQAVHAHHAHRHAVAIEEFLTQRYAAAYGRFAQLADEGHVPSAIVALMMVRHGPALFGAAWSATPEQLERWNAIAAANLRMHGAPLSGHDGE